eukprot:scaffold16550_cov148-Skeletonema_marinoi.AAC.1
MDWLRSSVFGVGDGGIDQQQQLQNGAAADAGEDESASSGPPSPSPRVRKRSKRDNDGVNNNYDEEDNDNESGSDGDGASGIVGRRINFGSRDNTSDDDDSNKSNSTDSSEEEEEDVLNTTVDTVENPLVEDVTNEEEHDCSDGVGIGHGDASGGDERVYVNDDAERQHVQMERQHWRDMEWDPDALKFFYKPGFDAQDGIPTAEGYDIIKPTHAGMQVRLVFNLSRDIIMACYEGEVNHLYDTLENLGIPKTIEGVGEHLFGARSRFVQTLARRLKKDERDVHKFLATFFFAAELGLPSKRLEQHPNIKFDKYMDQQDLNSFWRDIARIGKGGGEPTYLWQSVEDSLNADCPRSNTSRQTAAALPLTQPSQLQLGFHHTLWNVSKGGPDTVTKFTWNCLPVLPIRTPQTVVVARYLMLYAVLYHRLIQAVTGTKKLNTDTDTIQNVRDRANKRLAFHNSLGILSRFHLSKASDPSAENSHMGQTDFTKTPAPQFNRTDKDTQFEVDHSILGNSTGSTPIGKGRGTGIAKKFLRTNDNFSVVKDRYTNCTGFVGRIYKHQSDGKFQLDRQYSCDLCRRRHVTTMNA